jgi:hypothetical protein
LLVPVFDGREKLSLAKYWSKKYVGDVKQGSTVTILFSTRVSSLPQEAQAYKYYKKMKSVYLNVLAVIVLAEPSDDFYLDTAPDPVGVHGVDKLCRLSDLGGFKEVVEEEEVDDNVVGEVF